MTALAIERLLQDDRWALIASRAQMLTATCGNYLDQSAVVLRPASIAAIDEALRLFASG